MRIAILTKCAKDHLSSYQEESKLASNRKKDKLKRFATKND